MTEHFIKTANCCYVWLRFQSKLFFWQKNTDGKDICNKRFLMKTFSAILQSICQPWGSVKLPEKTQNLKQEEEQKCTLCQKQWKWSQNWFWQKHLCAQSLPVLSNQQHVFLSEPHFEGKGRITLSRAVANNVSAWLEKWSITSPMAEAESQPQGPIEAQSPKDSFLAQNDVHFRNGQF